jgi:hypothetical protein
MSYSEINKCGTCVKKDKCTDRDFIHAAVCGIHAMWPAEKGHLGSGTVTLDCRNLEEAKSEE